MSDIQLTIGRYRVMRMLGLGGMGVVYQAHDDVIDREVAIKLVHADLLQGEEREDFIERFQQEARAAARCIHPAIVAIYDFALHKGNPYLAMEFVDGVGLDRAIADAENKCLAPVTAVHIVLELLDALSIAHAAGIVHRDIKPANILLIAGGKIKVTDFGVARIANADITLHGKAVGTPRYMSPEQWQGQPEDARSDLFAVGVLLQEMLIAVHPYADKHASGLPYNLLHGEPKGKKLLVQCVGHSVAAVIQRALCKHRDDRFDSAAAMAMALRKAMDSSSSPDSLISPVVDLDKTLTSMRKQPAVGSAAKSERALGLEPSVISDIEHQLACKVGPIAHFLVKSSLKSSVSVAAFCDDLANRIDRPEDRSQFLTSAMEAVQRTTNNKNTSRAMFERSTGPALPGPSQTPAGTAAISADEIERVSQALAENLGPIAKVLVKRVLPEAGNAYELWDLLAKKITSDTERSVFLQKRATR